MGYNLYWSQPEDDILRGGHPTTTLMKLLPHRTRNAINNRRSLVRKSDALVAAGRAKYVAEGGAVTGRAWSAPEDAVLRNRGDRKNAELAEMLNRSIHSVGNRIKRLRHLDALGARPHDLASPPAIYHEPRRSVLCEWPDLGPNAFEDVKLGPAVRLPYRSAYYG